MFSLLPALNDNLANGQIAFEVIDGEPYVKVGADSVPKKLGSKGTIKCFVAKSVSAEQAGTISFTYDLSSVYENYQNITKNDIIGGIQSVSAKTTSALIRSGSGSFGKITSYDPKTGIISATVSISSQNGNVSVTVTPCFYIVT